MAGLISLIPLTSEFNNNNNPLKAKNFGKKNIINKLEIDDKIYRFIYLALGSEMDEFGLLGKTLNTLNQKDQFRKTLTKLEIQFLYIFQHVETAWKDKYLIILV